MTTKTKKQIKALALISGGLDSMLAAKIILEQNIHVEGIFFDIGFCSIYNQNSKIVKNASWVAQQLNMTLHKINAIEAYKPTLISPKHGYGSNLNPCLDCKIFMINQALQWALEHDFDFLITGEVIGQRPKSQLKAFIPIINKESGANDLILRPLCAKKLPESFPEKQGWVDRALLHAFHGRTRTPQFALAKSLGFDEYPSPAGGCLLTEPKYANRLKDLWHYRGVKDYTPTDIALLKIGRHIRPNPDFKCIIARDERDWELLEPYATNYITLTPTSHTGPLTLIDGNPTQVDVKLAAQITARFSAGRDADEVTIKIQQVDGSFESLTVQPLKPDEILEEWYI